MNIAFLLVWAGALLPAAAQAADNLLPNPSFEDGAQKPAGWIARAWQETDANAYWGVDAAGRTGRCVTIRSTHEEGADAAWTATVTVKPNTFYRLSGSIRTRDIEGARGALLNIQNMQQVRTPAVRGTRDWSRVETVFRTGETPTTLEVNCLFGGWGVSTGQAWYDDVAVEPVPELSDRREATLSIDPNAPSVRYSPLLLGGFIEHFDRQIYGGIFEPGSPLSDARGFRRDVIEAMRELKLSVVRWPGGCFASGYHWQGGVGKDRTPAFDMVWGVDDPNTFGTDEFVEWCRLVGCEPYICTNAGNGTPEEMRDWVAYCNAAEGPYARMRSSHRHVKPLTVRYWSIGNENWGGHEIGAKKPREWGPLVRTAAQLMRAVDPELVLIAAATADPTWTLPLLKAAGEDLNYVAIHEYWLPCWGTNLTPDYLSCIMRSEGPEKTITQVIEILEEAGYRGRIQIAFDEWNLRGWHYPGFPRTAVSDTSDPAVAALIKSRKKNADATQILDG